MALEDLTGTKYIDDLNSSNPAAGDNVSEGDDHIRGIKNVLKTTFPSIDGAITATDTELNYVDGVTSAIQTQINTKAPLASPTFTGTVAIPNVSNLETAVVANTAKVTNATHSGEVTGATALTIADNVVDEANLKVSNTPTNGYFLSAQSGDTGGLTWAEVGGGVTVSDTAPGSPEEGDLWWEGDADKFYIHDGSAFVEITNKSAVTSTGGTVTITAINEFEAGSYDTSANFTFSSGSPVASYAIQSGSVPAGMSLNTSTGVVSGTASSVGSNTASTFTIRATDLDSDTADQAYSWTINNLAEVVTTFTSGGTYTAPSGVDNVNIQVIGGGGGGGGGTASDNQPHTSGGTGGAGGYYTANVSVSGGGSYTINVGNGGGGGANALQAGAANGASGNASRFGNNTQANGGGGGYGANHGGNGSAGSQGSPTGSDGNNSYGGGGSGGHSWGSGASGQAGVVIVKHYGNH
jgi:hypothetical protein